MRFFVISLLSIFFTYLNAEESSKIRVKVDNLNISVPNSKNLSTDKFNAGKDILKELENISNLSVSANLKLALYYMGTNQEIFNKLGDDKRISFNQEFGGFIADKKLFAPNTNHKDLKKAYNFISQAIRLESSKNLPDWSLLRDYSIVKASIIIEAEKADITVTESQNSVLQELFSNILQKQYLPNDIQADCAYASSFYGYSQYNAEDLENRAKVAREIVGNKYIFPYWINFYYGYMLPKDKNFALLILEENIKNKKISALQAILDIYKGLYDSSDENPEKYTYYKKLFDTLKK